MNTVGQKERITQNRIIKLFIEQLGYIYLGNWEDRLENSNIEKDILRKYLKDKKGYRDDVISRAFYELEKTANNLNAGLYHANKNVYNLLRYGIKVKTTAGENYDTVYLIDWKHPDKNEFYIAEEVTILGNREKRPDIVLYINGIAIAVIELKRSTVSIGDGIRQSIVNQKKEFIEPFFSTIQFIFAGNDTEGLRYGTIKTSEKYFLKWKEDEKDNSMLVIDKYLLKMCNENRIIEIIYDFVLFDAGRKKLPRAHQYFGIQAAQEHIRCRQGGIIWHTQGSGKSIVMVILAKWILENYPRARIAIITDRDELDKQIEGVFKDTGEEIKRSRSGKDLMNQLTQPLPRLLCSLIHKFGRKDLDNFEEYIKELETSPTHTIGDLFIFVDECHRTQSGKLHRAMKAMLPNAVFIGFTGTPLLKKDKKTSLEVFGKYIHTYKFKEGVEDGVIRDLIYEARDIDQTISLPERIDEWFESKTKGLNEFQKSEIKKKWGTMQKVLSSRSRMEKVVKDIIFDFNVKPRLNSERGNALLVASSIFEACKYFDLFQKTELKGKCGLITSYNPNIRDITTEDTGANTETEKEFIYNVYKGLLGTNTTEEYEDESKLKFKEEPANMKLMIVVDKLLTGFNAPPCTYLYIDKKMQDHGLFQAICRVNRIDTDDKEFGYIVDYKDLFKKVENAIAVYTSELDYDEFEKEDCEILLQDRLKTGCERLENAFEQAGLICEPVENPKGSLEHIRYFCGNPEIPDDLKSNEPKRTGLYKAIVNLIRAYANIADELTSAGCSEEQIQDIKNKLNFYIKLREEIKKASGEFIDLKTYEADMRYLIDNYIDAADPKKISSFENMTLIELIVKTGISQAITTLPAGIKNNKESVAEVIANNVRYKIIEEHLIDPAFFNEMSILLNEIIQQRKSNAIDYEEYLKKVAGLAKKIHEGKTNDTPKILKTPARRALYNNLNKNETLAVQIDDAVKKIKKADFRGNRQKENEIKAEIYKFLNDKDEVERIFAIIKEQKEY